ncbi:acyl-CoA N-acyltransferase [Vararia minispora EC-137]|uniref:Acyl-CoA N-acyltransferase n=1 Tax=Vararia minispora EC-137 TaxID=1314806 RepID=A0ACB8Q7J4_9AGAM|nr:acyl-CoA N-acyltransferase [Vararia minispora EC-137]
MAFVNTYQPPALRGRDLAPAEDFGPDPYDLNFCFPLDFSRLECARVKLVAYIPRQHARLYTDQIERHPWLQAYFPTASMHSFADCLSAQENFVRRNPGNVLLAVIDKARFDGEHPEWGGSFAGIMGLFQTVPGKLSTEISWVITFPAFHRTGLATLASALLLNYCLSIPAEHGLGLRRVQWSTNPRNAASVALAHKLGFTMEGTLRWEGGAVEVFKAEAGHGRPNRKGDPRPDVAGRDTVLFGFCMEDWEEGGRELVRDIIKGK